MTGRDTQSVPWGYRTRDLPEIENSPSANDRPSFRYVSAFRNSSVMMSPLAVAHHSAILSKLTQPPISRCRRAHSAIRRSRARDGPLGQIAPGGITRSFPAAAPPSARSVHHVSCMWCVCPNPFANRSRYLHHSTRCLRMRRSGAESLSPR